MEEEEELAGALTDLRVRMSVSFVTPPATAHPATAPPVTARHATATRATRGGAASAATPASPQWTATDSPAAPCSPPRTKMKTRRAPLSRYMALATRQRARRWAWQEERGGRGGGRRPVEESRGSQRWRGPAIGTTLVRENMTFLLVVCWSLSFILCSILNMRYSSWSFRWLAAMLWRKPGQSELYHFSVSSSSFHFEVVHCVHIFK